MSTIRSLRIRLGEIEVGVLTALDAAGATPEILQTLLDYSFGRRPRAATMEALGIDDFGVLIRLLNAAGLPQPMVPLCERERMAAAMATVLADAAVS